MQTWATIQDRFRRLQRNDLSHPIDSLVTAGDLAAHLGLRESWVRNEERLGRLPSVRLGKYILFKAPAATHWFTLCGGCLSKFGAPRTVPLLHRPNRGKTSTDSTYKCEYVGAQANFQGV